MTHTLAQLGAMALYEARMHARRRPLIVITLTMLIIIPLQIFLLGDIGAVAGNLLNTDIALMSAAQAQNYYTVNVVIMTWVVVFCVLTIILPTIVADAVPLDNSEGVSELLNALPLRSGVYLAGKVLGIWLAMTGSVLLCMVVIGVLWWIKTGGYDMLAYLDMWLLGGLMLGLINTAFAVLLASVQGSRRLAVLMNGVLLILPSLLLPRILYEGSEIGYLNPIRYPTLNWYLNSIQRYLNAPEIWQYGWTSRDVLLTIAVGLVQVALLALIAWSWRRFATARR